MAMESLFTWGPTGVGALISTTQENRDIKELQNAVFSRLTLLDFLSKKGKVRRGGGGTSIIVPIRSSKNSTAGFYSNYQTIDVTPQDNETAAQFLYKQAAASISLSGKEERVQNKGKYEVINLVKTKIEDAEMTLRDTINTALFATTPGAADVGSLVTSIDETSTIGQINSTTYAFWQAKSVTGGSFSAQGLADMRSQWSTLEQRMPISPPELLLTTTAIRDFYEASLTPQQRFGASDNTGNGSFEKLKFKSAVVDVDSQCTSGVMYFLNSEAMELVIDPDTDFKMTDWVKPANQDARVAQYLVALELVVKNRRKLGKIISITA